MFDHLLHQCCWPTSMDSLLRCAPPLRNHGSIGFHSCLCSCPCLFPCFLCPCCGTNRVCCLGALLASFLTSVISLATRPFISSFSTMPWSLPIRSLLACSLARLVPFPGDSTQVFVSHVIARVRVALCRLRIMPTDVSQVHWCRSTVDHHFVDDDLQLFHDFIKLSRCCQELTFDVLRHHFPHHERLLRLIDHFELVLFLGHLQ